MSLAARLHRFMYIHAQKLSVTSIGIASAYPFDIQFKGSHVSGCLDIDTLYGGSWAHPCKET